MKEEVGSQKSEVRRPARSFEDLLVWQKAHALVLAIYRLTKGFPDDERYGLTSQMRRAAASVPANIAEGFKRRTRPEKARFMNIAQTSLEETRYFLILSRDLGYLRKVDLLPQVEEVSRMLGAYAQRILTSDF